MDFKTILENREVNVWEYTGWYGVLEGLAALEKIMKLVTYFFFLSPFL